MKIIALGDCHGRSFWKLIANTEEWDELVLIGDYFDTHEAITPIEQLKNFDELCAFKRASKKPVILLIGNHDYHYFPEIGYQHTSGYQAGAAKNIELALNQNRDLLQMAYFHEKLLFTHAGLGETWMKENFHDLIVTPYKTEYLAEAINDVWKYKPLSFSFAGLYDQTGDDLTQTPIWIRPYSLVKDSKNIAAAGIVQIVGHTTMHKLDATHNYIFIDTLGTSGEYLIVEDGKFSTNKI